MNSGLRDLFAPIKTLQMMNNAEVEKEQMRSEWSVCIFSDGADDKNNKMFSNNDLGRAGLFPAGQYNFRWCRW